MDDAAIVAGLVGGNAAFLFENYCIEVRAGGKELHSGGKADNPRPHDGYVIRLAHLQTSIPISS